MPNWNDGRYLVRCLRSILDQPVQPDEIIIVDDGSTDDSVAIIQAELAHEPRARLIRNEANLGIFASLEVGMRHLRSDYVLFLAANDFLLPGIFARAKACLARSPGIGVWSAMSWLIDEADRPIRLHPSAVIALHDATFTPEDCVRLAHRLGNWFTGTTLIYHREKLAAVGNFNPGYGATSDLFAALAVASLHGAAYSPQPFGGIRVHQGSYSSRALEDPAGLEKLIEQVRTYGTRVSPRLFSPSFLHRTALRYRFSAVRASRGAAVATVGAITGGVKGRLLAIVERIVPRRLALLRMVLAYFILVPFDVWPAFRYRALGWALVRFRATIPVKSTGSGANRA
jgi:hypothetical protein